MKKEVSSSLVAFVVMVVMGPIIFSGIMAFREVWEWDSVFIPDFLSSRVETVLRMMFSGVVVIITLALLFLVSHLHCRFMDRAKRRRT